MDELVKQLRYAAGGNECPYFSLAADEIERLQAERERHYAKRNEARAPLSFVDSNDVSGVDAEGVRRMYELLRQAQYFVPAGLFRDRIEAALASPGSQAQGRCNGMGNAGMNLEKENQMLREQLKEAQADAERAVAILRSWSWEESDRYLRERDARRSLTDQRDAAVG